MSIKENRRYDFKEINVVDTREGKACKEAENIPSAVCLGDIGDNLEFMDKGNTMIVFSQSGKESLPRNLFKYQGRIVFLEGGYDAWKTMIIGKLQQAYQSFLDVSEPGRENMIAALHACFTAPKMEMHTESAKPGVIIVKPKKRSGGCS